MPLKPNTLAPEFSLVDESNTLRTLSAFRGKKIVLYFYPKDDTPGCTTEACAFRDDYSAYTSSAAVIWGVSPDSPKSHVKFKAKYQLPFTLLSDEDHRIAQLYGVWGPKKFAGREYEGILRTTFIIGADGIIMKVFEGVKPDGHSLEVLEALK